MDTNQVQLQPVAEIPFQTILDYMNRGFEEYIVPAQFTQTLLTYLIRVDSVDFNASRIVTVGGEPAGIALLNSRGWSTRLGAFGIFKEWRGKGIGTAFTALLLDEARKRNDRTMVLEAICENHAAIRIYQKAGFEITRKLIGFEGKELQGETCSRVRECDPRLAAQALMQLAPNLPWQVSGESLLSCTSHMRAFRYIGSIVFLHTSGETHTHIRGLTVHDEEEGRTLLKHVLALYPKHIWRLSPCFPESLLLPLLPSLGFEPLSLAQYEMRIEFER